jgi:hypothetical protein
MRRYFLVLFAAALISSCTAMQQQKAGGAATPAATVKPSQFKNLQVLPSDISRDVLVATMRGYSRDLGVHCDYCHVEGPDGHPDFASDAKKEKGMGRLMIRMARTINHDFLLKVTENEETVSCWTCHRGHSTPEAPPPPPAENH